jgi:hypothetical protein
MNGCIHLCTTVQAYFYSTIFEKGLAQQRFLGVAPLANNLYQRAWARRQIDAAEPHSCILQFIWSQESKEQVRSGKSFPDLKLVIAHIASLLPSQLNASPARTLLCRSSPLQWRCNYSAVIAHLLPSALYIPPGVNTENLGESSSAASQPHLEHVSPH